MPDLVRANPKKKAKESGEEELKAALKKAKKMQAKVAEQSKKVPEGAEPESDSEDDEDEDDSEGDEDDSDDDDDGEEEEDGDDDDDESEDEEEEKDRMDTSAGSTPFKKKAENGSKKDKAKAKENKENATPKKKEQKSPKKENGTPKPDKTPKKENGNPKPDKTPKKGKGENPAKQGKTPKRVIKGGITVEETAVGNGPEAKRGKMVGMYYEGR